MTDDTSHRNIINMAARLVDNQAISYKEDVGDIRQIASMDKTHDYVPEIKVLKDTARILHDIADKIRSLEISSKVEGQNLKFTPAPGFTMENTKEEIAGVVSKPLEQNPYGKPIPVENKTS